MSKNKNLNSLWLTLAVILPILTAILFVKYTKIIPWYVLLALVALLEEIYVIPVFTINYYKFYDQALENRKWKAFIPIYNYLMTFGKGFSIASITVFGLFLLSSISTLVPSIFLFMGDRFILRFSSIMPTVIIVLFTLLNGIVGIGLYKNSLVINKYFHIAFPNEGGYTKVYCILQYIPFLEIVLFIVPIIRMIPLLSCIDKETSIITMGLNIDKISEISDEDEE